MACQSLSPLTRRDAFEPAFEFSKNARTAVSCDCIQGSAILAGSRFRRRFVDDSYWGSRLLELLAQLAERPQTRFCGGNAWFRMAAGKMLAFFWQAADEYC